MTEYPDYPTTKKGKKKPVRFGKRIKLNEKIPELSLGRKYKRTPSIGQVLKFDFGLKQTKVSKGLEETGLFGRAYIKPIKIPNLMGKVTRRKIKPKPKRKRKWNI